MYKIHPIIVNFLIWLKLLIYVQNCAYVTALYGFVL